MRTAYIFRALIAALVLTGMIGATTAPSSAQVFLSLGINIGSPPPYIPTYYQPPVPGPNYIWQPGYWAWGPYGYYWAPGTWVVAPYTGYLWTPGYWGYNGGFFQWNSGYWATSIGFYGGINYGGGYYGNGYYGGRWDGPVFQYNTYVSNVPSGAGWDGGNRYTYIDRSVHVTNITTNRYVSYNGGPNGVRAVPNAQQIQVTHLRHVAPTALQVQHLHVASQDRNLLASVNHGRPPVVAVAHPFTPTRRPAGFVPVRPADKALVSHIPAVVHTDSGVHAVPGHPMTLGGTTAHTTMAHPAYHAPVHTMTTTGHAAVHTTTSTYHAPVHTTTSTYHAPVHTTTSTYHAPVHATTSTYHAPVHTTTSTYHAPVHTTTSTYHAPVHTTTYHAQPAYHAPAHPSSQPHPQPQHTHGPRVK